MSDYGINEFYLYNTHKKNYKLYEQMIQRFFKKKSSLVLNEIRSRIRNEGMITNKQFYEVYQKYLDKDPSTNFDNLLSAEVGRQKYFIKSVEQLFGDEKNIPNNQSVYVDYGCNDGAFAVAIVKKFGIKPSNVYCCDIIDKPILVEKSKFNYIKIDLDNIASSIQKLPKTDLLTCINVFHHIPPASRGIIFKELGNILNNNAYTIIKEHNCNTGLYNEKYKNYIKEWHKLYAVLYGEADFMGEINFVSIDHIKVYMISMHSLIKSYIPEDDDDILKSYFALFVKFRPIST